MPASSPDTAAPPPRPPATIRTRPSLDATVIGLIYCLMMMFMGLAAINTQANLLFGIFGLMIGVLLASGVISRWVLRHVRVRRVMPESAAVGQTLQIGYEIDNRKKFWPTLSLTIAELDAPGAFDRQPAAYVLHAAAGDRALVRAEVVPVRRGLVSFDRYQVVTSFPFGFIKRAMVRRQHDSVLVHPAQGGVQPSAVSRFFSATSSGINQRPVEGGNDEFYGAREYRPGDPLRTIHWRRSARLGSAGAARAGGGGGGGARGHSPLVVKQMTRVSPPRLMLLVDTYVPAADVSADARAARDERHRRLTEVERNLAVAASLLSAADRRGLSVGLLLWRGEDLATPESPAAASGWGRVAARYGRGASLRSLARRFGLGRSPATTRRHNAAADVGRTEPPRESAASAGWLELRPERGKRHRRDLLAALAAAPANESRDVWALADRAAGSAAALGSETTLVLVTAADAATGIAARPGRPAPSRGRLVTVPTRPGLVEQWVAFDPSLDFGEMVGPD